MEAGTSRSWILRGGSTRWSGWLISNCFLCHTPKLPGFLGFNAVIYWKFSSCEDIFILKFPHINTACTYGCYSFSISPKHSVWKWATGGTREKQSSSWVLFLQGFLSGVFIGPQLYKVPPRRVWCGKATHHTFHPDQLWLMFSALNTEILQKLSCIESFENLCVKVFPK